MKKIYTKPVKKLSLLLGILLLLFNASTVKSQSTDDEDDGFSFTVALVSDQFFGFAPSFSGSYSINPTLDFTFYGILWSGGTAAAWGNWTEFGVGVNLNVADGFSINPNLGITGGNLLSSGTQGPSVFGDGIVPNFIVSLDKPKVEGEIYFGYYAPLRDMTDKVDPLSNPTTLAYVHYWANLGYKASSKFSLGLHFEHLVNTGGSEVTSSTDVFQWIGPYIQFSSPKNGIFARLSAGGDLVDGNDSFFKVNAGFTF